MALFLALSSSFLLVRHRDHSYSRKRALRRAPEFRVLRAGEAEKEEDNEKEKEFMTMYTTSLFRISPTDRYSFLPHQRLAVFG
jgi:hypothetical protein